MPVRVQDTIKTKNDADFPVVEDGDMKGGFRTVANAAARNAITTAHRTIGMWVVTQDDGKKWQLGSDLSTWTEFTGGGGGGFTAGGDLTGTSTNQTVSTIRTIGAPDPNLAVPGRVPTVIATPPFSTPSDVVWDSTDSKLWVADSNIGAQIFTYNVSTRRTTPVSISPFIGISGFLKLDIDSTYVYAVGGASPFPAPTATMFIFSRATGAIVGAGLSNKPSGIISDGAGHLFVALRNKLEKYTRATTLAAYPSVDTATSSLAVTGCNSVAWDGTNVFVTNGASSQVLKINPTSMTVTGTFTHPGGQVANFVFAAFGSIWGVFDTSVYKINATSMTGTATTGISGAVTLKSAGQDGTHLWVGDSAGANIYIIDPTTNSQLAAVTGSTNPSDQHAGMTYNGTDSMWLAVPNNSSIASHDATSPYSEVDYFTSMLDLEYQASGGGGFTAGGDLTGTTSSQTVVAIQGRAASASAPSSGNAFVWSGSAWAPTAPGGDLGGTFLTTTVTGLQGRTVASTAPTTSQVLTWTGSTWAPGTLPVSAVSLGEGTRILQRVTHASTPADSGAGWVHYPYLSDGSSGTYGPNDSWTGLSTWGFVLKDFSAWQNRGFAVLGVNSGGTNKIWFIANRIFGGFRFSGSASAPPPLITFNIGSATGSSTWTILEGAWGGNNLTSPSGVYGDSTGILLVGNPTTGDICRVARGLTPALLDPVVNLAAGPIAMSKILWTGGLYAWVVANGTLYCLSNLFQQGTNFSGSTPLTATAVSGLPAGVVATELVSDGIFLYVPDSANSKIHKISLATNLYVSSVTVATGPNNLVYDGENFWFTSTSQFTPTLYVVNSSGATIASWANGTFATGGFPLTNFGGNPIQGVFNGEYVIFMDPTGLSIKADPKSLILLDNSGATACTRLRAFADQYPSDVYALYYSGIQRLNNLHRPAIITDRLVVTASIAVAGVLAAGNGSNTTYLDDTVASGTGSPNNISRVYVSTKGGSTTIYLPRRPVDGMEVLIKDYYGRAATSNITIKSHQIYAGSSSGAASTPSGFPTFTDATVTNSNFAAVGIFPGDLIQITAGPSGAHQYRAAGPFGGTSFQVDEISVTNESGLTYTIVEPLEKSTGGQGDTEVINTARGYRRYQYCRFVGWVLLDWR